MTKEPLLPIYQSLRNNPERWETDRFLSPSELIHQTHRFMQTFEEKAARKALPTDIFFLDKGAHKIGEMFEILFPEYCPTVVMPRVHYINFGRQRVGPEGSVVIPFRGDPDIIKATYPVQEGARILIVDDFAETNDTRWNSQRSIARAYPQVKVESLVVYNKIPNWQGVAEYAGVDEYTSKDYDTMILQALNNELAHQNIHFDSLTDFILNHNNYDYEVWNRYRALEDALLGSIPTAKPLRRSAISQDAIHEEMMLICREVLKLKAQDQT